MKKRILLFGSGAELIAEFFDCAGDEFDLLTSSCLHADLINHIDFFMPDVLVFCMLDETDEVINTMLMLKDALAEMGMPLILAGNFRECEKFQTSSQNMGKVMVKYPVTADQLKAEVEILMEIERADRQKNMAEQAAQAAQAAQEGQTGNPVSTVRGVPDFSMQIVEQFPRKKILIVDDSPMTLRLLRSQLIDDYAVASAPSGAVALKYLEHGNLDLVLLDYEMPGMNGAEVLEKIRQNPKTAGTPVVFLTGINDKRSISKVLGLNPQAYLLKPVEKDDLLQCIANIIG